MADIDNQPTTDLVGDAASAKIKELAGATRTCMFLTALDQIPSDARPMAVQSVDDDGSIWFLSSLASNKNTDIAKDPRVMLTFQNESKSQYLSIFGRAIVHVDAVSKEKYWTAFANAWFDGKDDPRLSVIEVVPQSGSYWDTKDGKVIALAKMSWSALTGSKTDDGGIEGELKPHATHRASA